MTKIKKPVVVMLAAEAAPIIKVGGLADVAGSLPLALAKLNVTPILFLPLYGAINRRLFGIKKIADALNAHLCATNNVFNLWQTTLPKSNVKVYFIDHSYFHHRDVYDTRRRYDPDRKSYTRGSTDIKRFEFFCKASLASLRYLNLQPDVLHCHDWHTGITPSLLKLENRHDDFFYQTKTLLTIHNLANQGHAEIPGVLDYLCLPEKDFSTENLNFMKLGIKETDLINTVSPTYAKEILTPKFGAHLHRQLRQRRGDLYGILNGLDIKSFNPRTDSLIWRHYSPDSLSIKTQNKTRLQKHLGLEVDSRPLFAIISRLVYQKGLDLILPLIEIFIAQGALFVFLGMGDPAIEKALVKLAKKHPLSISVTTRFDERLARRIYAGADFFLMPSRFEPCGLGQMIAMRYGTLPIVRSIGGLKDTVNADIGFTFKPYASSAMARAIDQALEIYRQPKKFAMMKRRAMNLDFSWDQSAKKYLALYRQLLKP